MKPLKIVSYAFMFFICVIFLSACGSTPKKYTDEDTGDSFYYDLDTGDRVDEDPETYDRSLAESEAIVRYKIWGRDAQGQKLVEDMQKGPEGG